MNAGLVIAAAATLFRIVPLACSGDRLVVAGGGVLRLAEGATCAGVTAGTPIAISLDAANRATPHALTADTLPAAKLPRSAYALAPAAQDGDQTQVVTVSIDVTVPARTPSGDDIYLSTERSSWSPSEIRMDRVDARRYHLALQLHRGARVAFRITRGSNGTLERNAARALPPAHIAPGEPGAKVEVVVSAWADID